jgi:hypothetical protein
VMIEGVFMIFRGSIAEGRNPSLYQTHGGGNPWKYFIFMCDGLFCRPPTDQQLLFEQLAVKRSELDGFKDLVASDIRARQVPNAASGNIQVFQFFRLNRG